MQIPSASASGLQAFNSAQQRIDRASQTIARSGTTATDEVENQTQALLELNQGEEQAKVATRVISAQNQVIGSLLDVRA